MTSVKYIGMDVHTESTSIAVRNSLGKIVMEGVVETKASTLLQFLDGLRGDLHVVFEEGTWATWLYDLLKSQSRSNRFRSESRIWAKSGKRKVAASCKRFSLGVFGAVMRRYPLSSTNGLDFASSKSKSVTDLSFIKGFRKNSMLGPNVNCVGSPPSRSSLA